MPDTDARAARLRDLSERLRRQVYDAATGRADPHRATLLATGMRAIVARFGELEARTQRSVWNLSPQLRFDPDATSRHLDERSRRRGLDLRMVIDSMTEERHPLVGSEDPGAVAVAPVFLRVLVLDGQRVVVEGPRDLAGGEVTAWRLDADDLREEAFALWEETWAAARPPRQVGTRRLNDRELEVARGLCRGCTDDQIARLLRVSTRSVQRDVATVLEHLDVRSRTAAVATMMGKPFPAVEG